MRCHDAMSAAGSTGWQRHSLLPTTRRAAANTAQGHGQSSADGSGWEKRVRQAAYAGLSIPPASTNGSFAGVKSAQAWAWQAGHRSATWPKHGSQHIMQPAASAYYGVGTGACWPAGRQGARQPPLLASPQTAPALSSPIWFQVLNFWTLLCFSTRSVLARAFMPGIRDNVQA